MSRRIYAIRLSGGNTHQHIAHLWWKDPASGLLGDDTRAAMVTYVERQNGKVFVEDGYGHRVDARVVTPQYGEKYLRTYADGVWTDNLLALPRK